MQDLTPRVKVWLEKDGRLVFSEYRAELLRLIAETGSLAESAQRLGLSYRRAWGKIREIEGNLGEPLVESTRGGARGGRTHLTKRGQRVLADFDSLLARTAKAAGAQVDSSQSMRSIPQ